MALIKKERFHIMSHDYDDVEHNRFNKKIKFSTTKVYKSDDKTLDHKKTIQFKKEKSCSEQEEWEYWKDYYK